MIKTIEIDTSKEKASYIIKWLKDEIEKDKRLASNTLYPSQRMFYDSADGRLSIEWSLLERWFCKAFDAYEYWEEGEKNG